MERKVQLFGDFFICPCTNQTEDPIKVGSIINLRLTHVAHNQLGEINVVVNLFLFFSAAYPHCFDAKKQLRCRPTLSFACVTDYNNRGDNFSPRMP
jgi:hypothetical protein